MPSRRLNSPTTGIEPPMAMAIAGFGHSSLSAASALVTIGES